MSIIQGNAKQGSTRGFYSFPLEQSLRFNDDDSAYLSWTPASNGNLKTLTWSGWIKRGNLGVGGFFFTVKDSGLGYGLRFNSSTDKIDVFPSSGSTQLETSAVYRDPSAWYHVVMAIDTTQATASNRVKLYVNGEQVTSFSTAVYPTQNLDTSFGKATDHYLGAFDSSSLPFDGYLAEVNFIDGTALDADSFGELKNGVWIPKDPTGLTYGTNGFRLSFADDAEVEAFNTVLYDSQQSSLGVTGVGFSPDLVWVKTRSISSGSTLMDTVRGPSSMLGSASTGAESTTGGKGIVAFDSDGFTLGLDADIGSSNYSNGTDYVAWCWDAGANNTPTGHSSVTYTGNGSTGQRVTGFPFSPDLLWLKCRGAAENHNLMDTVRGWGKRLKTNATDAEQTFSGGGFYEDGFAPETTSDDQNKNANGFVAWGWDAGDGDPVSNTDGSITSTVKTNGDFSIITYTGNDTDGATVGHGLDAAPDFLIQRNRTSAFNWLVVQGNATYTMHLNETTASPTSTGRLDDIDATVFTLGSHEQVNRSSDDYVVYAWRNVTGKQKFDTYTGTGSTGLTVTTGFRPGFLMVKRDGFSHWEIHDGSRDPFANPSTKLLNANQSNAEDDNANGSFEFTDTGFIVQTTHEERNNSGDTYIYAAFAGSYSDYITDYNTDGSIDSRVKANDTTGFSITSFIGNNTAGATVGHGLSSAPDMIILKQRTTAQNWPVYHSAIGNTGALYLNLTNATDTSSGFWNNTSPTTSVFSLGSGTADSNESGQDFIAYCWAEKSGYSKFGSYTTPESGTDPNTITGLGFFPAWVMIKRTSNAGNWVIFDNTRNTDGSLNSRLYANLSNAESDSSSDYIDVADGQFTINGTSNDLNGGASTYIYAAFADTREAAFWLDQTSNDNDWQPVNLDHNDTVADSPTDNFATWNPLRPSNDFTFSDGNLRLVESTSGYATALSTMGVSSGKYYIEIDIKNASGNGVRVGIARSNFAANQGIGTGDSYAISNNLGDKFNQGSNSSYATSFTGDSVIGIALDLDAGTIIFTINGTSYGTAFTGLSGEWFFAVSAFADQSDSITANFGQQPFKYDPPA